MNFRLLLQALGLYALFAIPIFLVSAPTHKKVISFRQEAQRNLASYPLQTETKNCRKIEKWQYLCDQDRSQCQPQKRITYLNCNL